MLLQIGSTRTREFNGNLKVTMTEDAGTGVWPSMGTHCALGLLRQVGGLLRSSRSVEEVGPCADTH